ncbi:glycosyltransferase family 4 protein [Acidithiobacillus sp. HP-6]|uniref:glycosyltransferase family 4 protein n=1 Tax=unclassified Acidithiobacillus TaxID=2614800 RepID=UPI00187AB714|nr:MULTISPECIES: glycosyltransferase family 4 protein [unclassified Acidithiobacillus]MBE7561656.1 glycosyltransferase family 4 protein [Acidithiobacillus sp. HP-6]MBE7568430.1 glycosyltransferase family 4 protein [Acidithiobacillus sp. HP-2]
MRRIAIIHDWLVTYAGAERVLEQMLIMYPQADVFSVCDFLPARERAFLQGKTPKTTFIQNLPGVRTRYRNYLPLMPLAVEQLDLSSYDIVLSSSHAVAKGVLTGPDQLHVSYVHSPIRYAWDLQHQYLRESGLDKGLKGWVAKWLLHKMRLWDVRTANGVDCFVANSRFIARRIWKAYRREAEMVYPPVDVETFAFREDKEDFYLTASRLVPYKRVSLIVEAFAQMPEKRLKVIGDGPEREKIKRIASGHSNIELLGYQSSTALVDLMGRARAFVFAAEEDFGIAPVEAQACGTPVIAYGRGGVLDSVCDLTQARPTGVFFDEQSVAAIVRTVARFEAEGSVIRAEDCRRNAERFAPEQFRKALGGVVEREWERFKGS